LNEESHMAGTSTNRTNREDSDDDRMNEKFHTLLREAAEKREGRARTQSAADAVADKQESADLISLARSRGAGRRP
jgi:hypothetical protein